MTMKPPTGSPCNECPWRRKSLPGWLGPHTAEEWAKGVHGDQEIACHMTIPDDHVDTPEADNSMMTTCSGAAIYRSNVCKSPRDVPSAHKLPADTKAIFGYGEFLQHHTQVLGSASLSEAQVVIPHRVG